MVVEVSEKIIRKQLSNPSEQEQYINTLTQDIKLN
jgi:hypothetical protein